MGGPVLQEGRKERNRYPRETGWPRRWAVKIGKQARLASFIVPPFVSASRYRSKVWP